MPPDGHSSSQESMFRARGSPRGPQGTENHAGRLQRSLPNPLLKPQNLGPSQPAESWSPDWKAKAWRGLGEQGTLRARGHGVGAGPPAPGRGAGAWPRAVAWQPGLFTAGRVRSAGARARSPPWSSAARALCSPTSMLPSCPPASCPGKAAALLRSLGGAPALREPLPLLPRLRPGASGFAGTLGAPGGGARAAFGSLGRTPFRGIHPQQTLGGGTPGRSGVGGPRQKAGGFVRVYGEDKAALGPPPPKTRARLGFAFLEKRVGARGSWLEASIVLGTPHVAPRICLPL